MNIELTVLVAGVGFAVIVLLAVAWQAIRMANMLGSFTPVGIFIATIIAIVSFFSSLFLSYHWFFVETEPVILGTSMMLAGLAWFAIHEASAACIDMQHLMLEHLRLRKIEQGY